MSRKEQRETKRTEKLQVRARLVAAIREWETKKCPPAPEGADPNVWWKMFYAQQTSMVVWLKKQLALYDLRESKQHGPINEHKFR